MTVFVLNAGSSSLKYQLVDPDTGEAHAAGTVERIGESGGVPDHEAAVRQALEVQFYDRPGVQHALPGVQAAVAAGQLTPWAAAGQLLARQQVAISRGKVAIRWGDSIIAECLIGLLSEEADGRRG